MVIKSNKKDIQVLQLLENNIPHQITIVTTSRLTLKYNRQGILQIRKPKLMPFEKMEMFIEKHMDWIIKNYHLSKPNQRLFENGEEYLYLGNTYHLEIHPNKHQSVHLHDNIMYVFVPSNTTPDKVINKWKKEETEKIFSELLYLCFKRMEQYFTIYPKLEIKSYKARWGTCYPKKNKISLNISLIHVDIELIEFVIFHELSHFIHLDHSKEFHTFLKRFVPNETNLKKKLKKYKCDYK